MYSLKDPAPVYCTECWNNGSLDIHSFGVDPDFSLPFLAQLRELFRTTPRFYAYRFGNLINSDYTNYSKDQKNCYLTYSSIVCEDVLYSEITDDSKRSLDNFYCKKIDNCSYNVDCLSNYNSHYTVKSDNCIDSYFLYDCANCSNCFMSSNLRNQQYVFKNQKLSKEEYFKTLSEYGLGTHTGTEKAKMEFYDLMINNSIHKYSHTSAAENAVGDNIFNSKNIKKCFNTSNSENIFYSNRVLDSKDCMGNTGVGYAELAYESMAATQNTFKDLFCYITIQGSRECQYSMILKNCSNCFGCVGLTNSEYCILNKQYTKEEYFEKVEQIKQHMNGMPYVDSRGRVFTYGEFFPYEMSPFGYNESNAHEYFPISKDEAEKFGFNWLEKDKKNYLITKQSNELPDDIAEVEDSILGEIIGCPSDGNQITQCTGAYRIIPAELDFYRQKNLALPRLCPNCRHYERLKYRNKMRFHKRRCACTQSAHGHSEGSCVESFLTTFPQDSLELVYCESCYNKEIY